MRPTTYQDIGLPVFPEGEWIFCGLQYCRAARTLLVTLRSRTGGNARRVHIRTSDEARYREVIPSPPGEFWSACVASAVPVAFFGAREGGTEGLVVYRSELPGSTIQRLPPPRIDGDHARVWLSDLHAAAADGTHVIVSAALQPPPARDGSYQVRYVLAEMAVADGALSIVAELPAVFA